MALYKFTLREIQSRPGRAILTLLSVVIGVAAVVSVSVATQTTRRVFSDMFATLNGRSSLEVTSQAGAAFDQSVEDTIAKVPGVKATVPVIHEMAIMYYNRPGEESKKVTVTLLGIDPNKDRAVRDFKLVAGKPVEGKKDVLLMDNDFAQSLHLDVNDKVRLMSHASGKRDFTIVGLVRPQGVSAVGQGVMYMSLATAQKRFYHGDAKVDGVQIVYNDGADPDKVEAGIKAVLPAGLVTLSPMGRRSQGDELLMSTEQALFMATCFSWLLAFLIVFNTFQMNVVERRRQLAILRAIGATRGQMMGIVCREGLVMGIIGTCLGIVAGLGGARVLSWVMAHFLQVALPSMQISWLPLVVAMIVGPVISLLGAFLPAWRAGRLSPLEGMGAVLPSDMEAPPWTIAAIGALILLAGGGLLAASLLRYVPVNIAVIAALMLLVGLVFLIPMALGTLTRIASGLLSPLLHVEGSLAEGQIVRRRGRTTLTVGVVFLALSFGVGMSNTIVDNINDVDHWAHNVIKGDFYVRTMNPDMSTGQAASLPAEMDEEIHAIPGIASIQTIRLATSHLLNQGEIIVAGDFASGNGRQFDLETGDPEHVHEAMLNGDVLIGTVLALRAHLKAGDAIPVETLQGHQTIHVAGTVNDYLSGGLTIYMDKNAAKRMLGIEGVSSYAVRAASGHLDEVAASLKVLCDKFGVLRQTQRELLDFIDGKKNMLVGCLMFLLVLVCLVSAFGVVNTLTMNVIEQTRELGLLRIVAMTRRQVRKMVLSQAAILASIGLTPGVFSGLGVAFLIDLSSHAVLGHSIVFVVHGGLIAACFLASFVIVLLSAWFPAARAARLNLVEALQYQ